MARRSVFVRLVGRGLRGAAIFGAMLAVLVPACGGKSIRNGDDDSTESGDDGDGQHGGRGGSSGESRGGLGAMDTTGGFVTGFPTGGTVPSGGTVAAGGSTPAGGTGGTNGARGPSDPQCRGARSNLSCVFEGKLCEDLTCGLAESGVRHCHCATYWQCTACDFTDSPFRDRPPLILPCRSEVADEVPCDQPNTLCGPLTSSEYCACYEDAADGLIWDCYLPPSSWN